MQIVENKCIRYCLRLNKMNHISEKVFRIINCLLTSTRVEHCINTVTFKFVNNPCAYYLKEIFEFASPCRTENFANLQNLRFLFAEKTWDRKLFYWLVLPCGTVYLN